MPLKLCRRQGSESWYVRGTVAGQPVFESTRTADREQAEGYRVQREGELWNRRIHGARATVTLLEAAVSYLEHERRSENTKALVHRLLDHFCPTWDHDSPDPSRFTKADAIGQEEADRAAKAICRPDAAQSTRRRNVYVPLGAILAHAAKRGWCAPPAFDLPKQPKGRTRWLKPDEAVSLIEACALDRRRPQNSAAHLQPLLRFYLGTGARVSEALDLQWDDLDLGAGVAMLRETKNGSDRLVHLSPANVADLANLPHRDGHVFRNFYGRPFADYERRRGGQLRAPFGYACELAGITGLTPHDLRHTWATWFYAATRDPLRLKEAGGWSSLDLVQRYAHLMPSHLLPGVAAIWGCAHPDEFPAVQGRAEPAQSQADSA